MFNKGEGKIKGPCLGCSRRKLHCHEVCSEYLQYREDLDKLNNQIKDTKNTANTFNEYANYRSLMYWRNRNKKGKAPN